MTKKCGQSRRNEQVSRNVEPAKTESRRNRLITKSEIESVKQQQQLQKNKTKKQNKTKNQETSLQTKAQDRRTSLGNSTKHTKKNLYLFF